jgi:hypothetical protein
MTLQQNAPVRERGGDPREYFDCEVDYFAEELQAQDDYSPTPEPTPEPTLTQE